MFLLPDEKTSKGGHYSPAILSNGILYISGQLAINPENGELAEGGIKEHTLMALRNIERILKAAGATKHNVIQCRIYIPDISYWNNLDEVYKEFFSEHKPARIVVPCGKLHHNSLVEIEALAEIEDKN